MRIWGLSLAGVLVAFNMYVEATVYERQQPDHTSFSTKSVSASLAPVAATIIIQDSRPRPADSGKSGIDTPLPALAASSAQTSSNSLNNSSDLTNDASLTTAASSHPGVVDPTVLPDVPITTIFLILFLVGAYTHAWRGYKLNSTKQTRLRPTLSVVALTFCVLRVLACCLRIGRAALPTDEGLRIAELIIFNIGSVTIYMVSAILAQRLVRHFSLTSLSGSSWRLTTFWLSNVLLIIASISSIVIIVAHSVGTSLVSKAFVSNDPLGNDPMIALAWLRTGVAALFTLGALYITLIVIVVATARTLPRTQDKLGYKLAVFFIGAVLLEVGQGVRLAAVFLSEVAMGRVAFYVTGFMLEVLVIFTYAVANLDLLFIDSSTTAKKSIQPRSAPFTFTRNDEHSTPRGGITIRKSLDITVSRLEKGQPSHAHNGRSPSVTSDYSDDSSMVGRTSRVSDFNFPMLGFAQPKPAHTTPSRHEQFTNTSRSVYVIAKPSS